jgi:hypothetical protein
MVEVTAVVTVADFMAAAAGVAGMRVAGGAAAAIPA